MTTQNRKSILTAKEYEAFFVWLTETKELSELTAQLYAGHISKSAELSSYSYRAAQIYYAEYKGNKRSKNIFETTESGDIVMHVTNRKGEVTLIPVKPGDQPLLSLYRWYPSVNSRGYLTVCAKINGKTTTLAQFLSGSDDARWNDEP